MAKPILGFPSKKEALAHIRTIRDRYKALEIDRAAGAPHVPLTGKDAEVITALVRMHAHVDKIIGPGIAYHYVAPDDTGSANGWGFRTVRADGTEDVWSFNNALNGKQPSPEQRAKQALRWEVEPWCQKAGAAFDADVFGGACYITGKKILDNHDSELHHAGDWPFWRIVREWMLDERLGWDDVKVENARDGRRELVGIFQLADRDLAQRFIEFHAERADIVRVLKGVHKVETKAESERRRGGHYGRLEFPDSPFDEGDQA